MITAQPLGRPIAHQTLSWGLLAVPVAIHSAVGSAGPKRRQVRRSDGSAIKMVRTAAADGQPVEWADVATAVQGPDGWVIADTDTVADPKDKLITLHQTTTPGDVAGMVRDGGYLLAPQAGAAQAVRTLSDALTAAALVGVVTFTMRSVTRLGVLRPDGAGGLVLDSLAWPDQHRATPDVDARPPTDAELATAVALVEGMRTEWDAARWASPQAARLRDHAQTATPITTPTPTPTDPDGDRTAANAEALIAALRASVEATRTERHLHAV